MSSRSFNLVLLGATGFTGKLCAQYLSEVAPANFKWAICGRNEQRLKAVLKDISGDTSNIGLLVADSGNLDQLRSVTEKTTAVISTVGPYAKYGSNLVEACVATNTHYADITGEPQWVHKMIKKHHEAAKKNNTVIVHCSGFDSLPADLGTHFAVNHMKTKMNQNCVSVRSYVTMKGSASGGTIASMITAMEAPAEERKLIMNPYLLNPENTAPATVRSCDKDCMMVGYDKEVERYTYPFVMQAINNKIVRRSAGLIGPNGGYGTDDTIFSYNEASATSSLPKAVITYVVLAIFVVLLSIPMTRGLLAAYVLPKPGQGPSKAQRDAGWFHYKLLAKGDKGAQVLASVRGPDPGYGGTSKMLVEAGLSLALDYNKLPAKGGVLTGASALGDVLINRINNKHGFEFKVDSEKQ